MKKLRFTQFKRMAIAIPIFLVMLFCVNNLFAQVSCFSVSAVAATSPQCSDNECGEGDDAHDCDECVIVTITHDKCPGLTISSLIITSDEDEVCYSVCGSPSNDFTVTHGPWWDYLGCSWYNPRVLTYAGGPGIPYMGSKTFKICKPSNIPGTKKFNIALPPGTTCGGNNCNVESITF